jgi:RimJ/RimL family protein N-acetyltransferase
MNWIQHPVILEGARVKLVPLDSDHFPKLLELGKQEKIWEYISINGADEQVLLAHLRSALLKRATGEQYAFTVIDRITGNIIGSTLFHNIYPVHRKLEIGWTWYDPAYWRTGYNVECKLLLLTYAFETLKTVRVQLQTDANNQRSRTAIEGIGAVMEGMMRKERIRSNGEFRTTVMYSIIDNEWPAVKRLLQNRLDKYK